MNGGWELRLQGVHVDKRLTSDGVVGVLQPLVVIEASEDMTDADEAREWQSFTMASMRDGSTGDRLLQLWPQPPANGVPGRLEVRHLAAVHSFDVSEVEWSGVARILELVSVPVVYQFRSQPELVYRGVVTDGTDAVPDVLSGDGAELWLSRFGRASRPKSDLRAMNPASRNLVEGTSAADVFVLDLTSFEVPGSPNCVFCAQQLAGEENNREHLVPDWMRSLASEHFGVPVDGVVAHAHRSCNDAYGAGEDAIRGFTVRHLSGEDLAEDELNAVAYWMAGKITMLDRAAGIEPPRHPPLDMSFQSSRTMLSLQYAGRLGDVDYPPFRTLTLGPWIYHCCWSEDGCGVETAE